MASELRINRAVLSEHHPPLCPELDAALAREYGLRKLESTRAQKLLERTSKDPELYIFGGFCRTADDKDRRNPRKPFPRKPHLLYVLNKIMSLSQGEIFAMTKSRQIMISWLLAAVASFEARAYAHSRTMIQAKKAEDTWHFVYWQSFVHSRIGFIEAAQPPWMRMNGLRGTRGHLWYPSGAIISAMPQGADAARSYSASLYVFDEAAFQVDFGETFRAVVPMAKGDPNIPDSGGRIVLTSSAKGGTDYAEIVEETDEHNFHREAA